MIIDNIKLLKKIISLQFAVIEGNSLRTILRQETRFFVEESGASAIAVCVENEKKVDIELILEKKHKFLSLLTRYKLVKKHIELNKFMEQCHLHFSKSYEHVQLDSLQGLFDGHLSKKKTAQFEKEMNFEKALVYPMRNKHGKKIGLIIYLFSGDSQTNSKKLLELTEFFAILIRPFYDEKRQVLRAKCVQIDEKMQRLTDKEKLITQRVLLAKPYKVIAKEMDISINTLKTHMKNIFSKYGVNSKIELHNKLSGGYVD